MTRTQLPQLLVDQTFDSETGSRVIVSLRTRNGGRIVLDMSPDSTGDGIDVEAYTNNLAESRIDRRDWTRGKFGPLELGQVATYGARPLADAEKAER